jgi:homoserine/homoserine lactone efflux protein
LLVLTHGARFGIGPAAWTVLGGALGFLLLIAASLAGMGALLATSEAAFTAAKCAGAAYLVFLGVRLWRAPAPVFATGAAEGSAAVGTARPLQLFGDGLFVAVSNPKALLFFAAFLQQFMVPGASFASQLLVLGGTSVLVEVVYELVLAGLAGRIAPWLGRHSQTFNRAAGGTFVGIGAALATTSR